VVFGLPPRIEADGHRGSTASGRVRHVAVDHYQSVGIDVTGPLDGPTSQVTVADNIVSGRAELATEQFAIVVDFGAVVRVTGNTVAGGVCTIPGCGADPINEFQSMGIVVVAPACTTVAGNHISGNHVCGNDVCGNDVGVYQIASPSCCTISEWPAGRCWRAGRDGSPPDVAYYCSASPCSPAMSCPHCCTSRDYPAALARWAARYLPAGDQSPHKSPRKPGPRANRTVATSFVRGRPNPASTR
jgi:hypothetical protein